MILSRKDCYLLTKDNGTSLRYVQCILYSIAESLSEVSVISLVSTKERLAVGGHMHLWLVFRPCSVCLVCVYMACVSEWEKYSGITHRVPHYFMLFCRLVQTNKDDTFKMVMQDDQEVPLTTPFPSDIPLFHSGVDTTKVLQNVHEVTAAFPSNSTFVYNNHPSVNAGQMAHTDLLRKIIVEGKEFVAAVYLESESQTRKSEIEGFQCKHLHEERFTSIVVSHKHLSVCQAIQFLPHLPFIKPVEVFQVTSTGGVYRDDSLGICITVPEDAVPEFTIFPIEVGTFLYGRFQFPEGSTPISPILMLCPQKNIPLKKPITVTLPHILFEATKGDVESLNIRVVKADHTSFLFPNSGLEKSVFEDINLIESRISFDDQNSITFSVSHFCFFSVRANNAKKKRCCICPLIPIDRSTGAFTYRLCVTYFMQPCIQVRCIFISTR